ncbi:bone morphogenetic protein 8B-like [Rana temporaria]|uniref:bone morphogenetic protein 8B-like n=1 Tax=Rana temporaria TaxID=8407 RepID=UPI001AAC7FA0|nr:bone morphogenetic protein 8B-like [Rana temporaria]XP_040192885.1 bone morphogenetic protein 8B-like [Rana temporaria]XP_040192886.1 bone morphogenetic protein 8B-like [Rana temporaria]XP_040192887.1 bone morphogenetic protein 8B-like [Rana temporaria]
MSNTLQKIWTVICIVGFFWHFTNGSFVKNHLRSSFIQRKLSGREKREMQKEILSILGLPGRPRPASGGQFPSSAPLFMLDLYHAMCSEEEEDGTQGVSRALFTTLSTQSPPLGAVISEADTVMSFVNMVEHDRDIFHQKPYWKEFKFDMTQVPTGETVTAAEFRLFKTRSFSRHFNRTLHISVYEIHRDHAHRQPELNLLDHESIQTGDEGWLVFDVTAASNHWLLNAKYNAGLRLYVENDEGQSIDPSLAGILGRRAPRSKQPFMVTFFQANKNQIRSTRAVKQLKKRQQKKHSDLPHPNKLPGVFDHVHVPDGRQVCKRHELYVSFRDLGWLDWVIAPQGYSAFYCEGECSFPLDSCMNATNHAILQSLVHLMKPESVPKACCAPTKLSATSVLYYDNNNNVILKKHRNMVVKSCGCH